MTQQRKLKAKKTEENISDVMQVDDVIRAQIIKTDPQERKIGLSIKALKEEGTRGSRKKSAESNPPD